MIQFDEHIFEMGWNHQLAYIRLVFKWETMVFMLGKYTYIHGCYGIVGVFWTEQSKNLVDVHELYMTKFISLGFDPKPLVFLCG